MRITVILAIFLLLLAACAGAPNVQRDDNGNMFGIAAVEHVSVRVASGPLPHPIIITAQGTLPDTCTQLDAVTLPDDTEHLQISLTTMRASGQPCKKQKQPFSKEIVWQGLGLRQGEHVITVNGVQAVFVLEEDNLAPTPTPTSTPLPPVLLPAIEPTATPAPTAVTAAAASPESSCTHRITFVSDITVPDKSKIAPAARFTKTWRLRNSGTCTWTEDYQLVFAGQERLSGPESQALGQVVKPGKTIDISVSLVAPSNKGTYASSWLLQTPSGHKFGLGKDGRTPFWLKIRVPRDAPSPEDAVGSIGGTVWHDLCASNLATAESLPPGCDIAPQGGVRADGVHQPDEPPIVDAEVSLGLGACPASGLAVVRSNSAGRFVFEHLKAATYCLSIDASSEHNHFIFIPGQWTTPPAGQITVKLGPGQALAQFDFGWDYEMAP